jgi:hypothetical protein
MKKLLLLILLFGSSVNGMSDSKCGVIKSSDWNSPNDILARLNGPSQLTPHCEKCKQYYLALFVDLINKFVEDLYNCNFIDLETMEHQLKLLRNEKNTEMIEQVLAKINSLKD